jgi:putative ABC transport system permease protein
LREADAELLRERVSDLKYISPEYIRQGVQAKYGDQMNNTHVHGVWPEFGPMRNFYPQPGGRFLNQDDIDSYRRVIFLGDKIKERLFGKEDAVGKTITINNIPFTVIGVMREKLQTSSYSWMDTEKVLIPASTFRIMFGHLTVSNMVFSPKDPQVSEQVQRDVYEVLGAKYKFDPEDESTLNMWDTIEQEEIIGKVFFGIQIFLGIIGSLTLIVAGVGLANIMYAIIKNRTREIGIKLAVGAKPRNIILEYIFQSFLTVFAGGWLGLLFSWLMIKIINMIPLQGEQWQYLGRPVLSISTTIVVTLILGLVAFTAGIFPARRAASINPAEALRYE